MTSDKGKLKPKMVFVELDTLKLVILQSCSKDSRLTFFSKQTEQQNLIDNLHTQLQDLTGKYLCTTNQSPKFPTVVHKQTWLHVMIQPKLIQTKMMTYKISKLLERTAPSKKE